MTGQKALFLENWAQARGRAFVRFDYRGHGASSGEFEECALSEWVADARAVLERLCEGPQILIGSSMGGWISFLVARAEPSRVAGLIGIATAADFTEDGAWDRLTETQRAEMMANGRVAVASEYSDEPSVYTRRLFEDGRRHLILRSAYPAAFPVRLLHASGDVDVLPAVSQRLFDHLDGDDIRLTLVKGSDHRFSGPQELALIGKTLHGLTQAIGSEEAR